jgi:hypothetical protein
MSSPFSGRVGAVLVLAAFCVVWSGTPASGVGTAVRETPPSAAVERERLLEGFEEIQRYFSEQGFSLIAAWRGMRSSDDPDFFDRSYPDISIALDRMAVELEQRFGSPAAATAPRDYTFVLERFAGRIADPREAAIVRDNALATVCMVCAMDGLRCDARLFHATLRGAVENDASAARKTEALRWLRRTEGAIDEALIERALTSAAGADPELRAEAAKVLFGLGTRRSLEVQRLLLAPTEALGGASEPIACTAMRHLTRARVVEAAPDMIEALADPSREVRACAAESLGRMSGLSPRFDPAARGRANDHAVAQWRAWWNGRRASGAAGSGGSPGAVR